MAGGGDLAGQPAQHHGRHLRRVDAGEHAAGGFDPHFAGAVDQQVGDVVARQPGRQRRQIGVEIDPRRHFEVPAKSRSRVTKTCSGVPCGTFMVTGMSICFCKAMLATWLACCCEPMMMAVPLSRSVRALSPAPITDSRMALPKRSKKCVSVSPSSPPRPSGSVPGEPMSMETPSGVRMRDHTTKARVWLSATPLRYWPTSLEPRGISTVVPSKPRTSRLTTARTKPGKSELIAVSRMAGITVPWGAVWDRSRSREECATSTLEPLTLAEKRSSADSLSSLAAATAPGPPAATGVAATPATGAWLKSTTMAGEWVSGAGATCGATCGAAAWITMGAGGGGATATGTGCGGAATCGAGCGRAVRLLLNAMKVITPKMQAPTTAAPVPQEEPGRTRPG